MKEIIQLIHDHPVYAVLIGKALWGALVDAFPAPTAQSGQAYKVAFSFVNALAFNFARAKGATIESSPNFIPAAEKYMADKKSGCEAMQPSPIHTDWQQPEEKK